MYIQEESHLDRSHAEHKKKVKRKDLFTTASQKIEMKAVPIE